MFHLTSNFNNFETTETNYDMTAALDNSTCTNFIEFGKDEDRVGRISWSQIERNDNKYLEIQMKVFRIDDKAVFRKHQQ